MKKQSALRYHRTMMNALELKPIPIRYEWLNDLYEQTDQTFCLNQIPLPLEEAFSRNYFLAVRTGRNGGFPFLAFALTLGKQEIGKAELTLQEDGRAELDLILKREFCHRGYGSEALRKLIEKAKEVHFCMGIAAYVNEDHAVMKKLLENAGFVKGRGFTADVLTPEGGAYRMKEVRGREYILDF